VSGYVRLYRTLFGHPAFRNDAEAMAFAWMVGRASWQAAAVRYKGHRISLKRGQLAISQRDMAEQMDRDKGWVERLWRRLRSEAMIEADVKAGVAVITICNYDEYQPTKEVGKAVGKALDEADARQTQGTEQVSEEVKKISSVSKDTSPRPFDCPVGVSRQVWSDFMENRKRKRLGKTATAWKSFNDDLTRISAQTGIPPPILIERCTAKGWGAIYDPRDNRNERSDHNPLQSAVQRIIGQC
jgi:DNA-binding transcriptional regulator YhcF (GntR family)